MSAYDVFIEYRQNHHIDVSDVMTVSRLLLAQSESILGGTANAIWLVAVVYAICCYLRSRRGRFLCVFALVTLFLIIDIVLYQFALESVLLALLLLFICLSIDFPSPFVVVSVPKEDSAVSAVSESRLEVGRMPLRHASTVSLLSLAQRRSREEAQVCIFCWLSVPILETQDVYIAPQHF